MAIFLIRPGETDYDVQDRLQGTLNLPLTERGISQVDALIEQVQLAQIDRIYCGPNEPALSTARRISRQLDIPLKVLDQLSNVDLGLWQGLCLEEIRAKQPRVFKQWREAPGSVCPPQGEAGEYACERIQEALRKPVKKGGVIAIVASEPLASLIECQIRGESPDLTDSFGKQRQSACCQQIDSPTAVSHNTSAK